MYFLWNKGFQKKIQNGCQIQAGQTYKDSFKLDLAVGGDGGLSNREKPGAAGVLGISKGKQLWNTAKELGHVPLKRRHSPIKIPLQQCTQYG